MEIKDYFKSAAKLVGVASIAISSVAFSAENASVHLDSTIGGIKDASHLLQESPSQQNTIAGLSPMFDTNYYGHKTKSDEWINKTIEDHEKSCGSEALGNFVDQYNPFKGFVRAGVNIGAAIYFGGVPVALNAATSAADSCIDNEYIAGVTKAATFYATKGASGISGAERTAISVAGYAADYIDKEIADNKKHDPINDQLNMGVLNEIMANQPTPEPEPKVERGYPSFLMNDR